jgi:RNA polymerase sigma-70 factor (ECF subfamily)
MDVWALKITKNRTTRPAARGAASLGDEKNTLQIMDASANCRTMGLEADAYDHDLVQRIRVGDTTAFAEVYRTHYVPLIKIAIRYLESLDAAEDVLHDVFMALWDRRAELVVQHQLRTYLVSAVRHRAIDEVRKRILTERIADGARGGETPGSEMPVPGMGKAPESADQMLQDEEIGRAIVSALQRLPERSRRVLLLRWQRRMSYEEIAQVLGISVAAAKQQGSRGLAALRPFLEQFME